MSLYSFEGKLKPLSPFDFSKSLAFLSDFSPMKNEQQVKETSFTKAVQIEGLPIAFEVSELGNVENPKLTFTGYSETKFTDEIEKSVVDRINFFLSLQDDLKEFYEIAKKDVCFKPAIEKFYGHKQVKFITPFEIACWAILAQRIPMAVAHKMKERVAEKLGGHIKVKGIDYQTFPECNRLKAIESAELLEMIPNKRKVEYIEAVTDAFSQIDEHWLRSAPFDEVYEWLTDIKGIGDWSANFIMVRGLGRMEKLASIGPELAMDAGRIYAGKDEPMAEDQLREVAEKYGNWKGYWAYYVRIYAEFAYVFKMDKT